METHKKTLDIEIRYYVCFECSEFQMWGLAELVMNIAVRLIKVKSVWYILAIKEFFEVKVKENNKSHFK